MPAVVPGLVKCRCGCEPRNGARARCRYNCSPSSCKYSETAGRVDWPPALAGHVIGGWRFHHTRACQLFAYFVVVALSLREQ